MDEALERAAQLVRAFERYMFDEPDVEKAMTLAHPDFRAFEAPGLPYGGVYEGIAGQQAIRAAVLAVWEFENDHLDFEILPVTADLVIVRATGRATLIRTGETHDFKVCEWYRIRDGLLAEIEIWYWDQQPMLDAYR